MEKKKVESWKSRIGQAPDYELYRPSHVEGAMLDEISDLRVALTEALEAIARLERKS